MKLSPRSALLTLSLLLASSASFAAEPKFLDATSEHFNLYTTENEAAAKATLVQFETARAYLVARTGGVDQFQSPVRLVAYKSNNEYRSHLPASIEAEHCFSKINGDAVTIVMDGINPRAWEYGLREYVNLVLVRSTPGLPYWLRMGLRDLYSTMRIADGTIRLGEEPFMEQRPALTAPAASDLSVLFGLHPSDGWGDTPEAARANGKFLALGGFDSTMGVGVSPNIRYTALYLTRLMMLGKDYGPKFGVFVNALSDGRDTTATFRTVYDQALADVGIKLRLAMSQAGIPVANVKFSLPAAPAPRLTDLSAADSATLINEIKARK